MKTKQLRTKAITLNFTEQEFLSLKTQMTNSTCPNMALYLRKRLYSRKIVTTFRNRSQDDILEELANNRKCLEKICQEISDFMDCPSSSWKIKEIQNLVEQKMKEQTLLIKKLLDIWLP